MFALYYDGKLIGVITDTSPYGGDISDLCNAISPNEGACDAHEVPGDLAGELRLVMARLPQESCDE